MWYENAKCFVYTTRNGRWSVSVLFLPESGAPDPVSEKSACKALTSAKIDKMNHIFGNRCSSNAVKMLRGKKTLKINDSLKSYVRCWKVYRSTERDICYQSTSKSLALAASALFPIILFNSSHITRASQSDPRNPPDRWNPDSPCVSCSFMLWSICKTVTS